MTTKSGWQIQRSIALELDVALSLASSKNLSEMAMRHLPGMLDEVPDEWRSQAASFHGRLPGEFLGPLSRLAMLADLLFEEDFATCTLQLRDLNRADLARLARAKTEQLAADAQDSDTESAEPVTDTELNEALNAFRSAVAPVHDSGGAAESAHLDDLENDLLARVVRGGEDHARFWHWVDRFFYEFYQPWRRQRRELMEAEHDRAAEVLGAERADDRQPRLDWLPPQNPLISSRLLREAVEAGDVQVVFWVEPMGLWDVMLAAPRSCVVSFAAPGEAYESFRAHAENIAERLKALADPTRLSILRLIRHMEVDNSDIASYLEIARPTVSIHAKRLREADLITSRKEGRSLNHTVDADSVRSLLEELTQFLALPEKTSG